MQMIFQDPYASLNPRKTVGNIVAEGLRIHDIGDKHEQEQRVEGLMAMVGLICNIAYQAPDLVAIGTTAPPATAGVGELYVFPTWALENQGNITGTAENRPLRHGFFLAAPGVNLVELDQEDDPTNAIRIGWVSKTGRLPAFRFHLELSPGSTT